VLLDLLINKRLMTLARRNDCV